MSIYTCAFAGLLALHCIENLAQGQVITINAKGALLLLAVMALCISVQFSQQAALSALMADGRTPYPRNASYWALLTLPLLHALLTALALGLCLQVRKGSAPFCLALGLIGVLVRILVQLFPTLVQGPLSLLFDSALVGPASVDQLTLCVALLAVALRAWLPSKIPHAQQRRRSTFS